MNNKLSSFFLVIFSCSLLNNDDADLINIHSLESMGKAPYTDDHEAYIQAALDHTTLERTNISLLI